MGICGSCGQGNRSGARFCSQCGAGLPVTCASCGAELAPDARFCDDCGAALTASRVARKVVSVVFGDLVGSTALQETLDPETTRGVMARFYDAMGVVVARHGGEVHRFVGDAVIAIFGTPVVGEDDALRAVRCASDMVAALETLGDELDRERGVRLRMRTGVNTGELVVSDGELVGDTMNTAARFEQAAGPGEVLFGEPTWRLVRHNVQLEEIEPLTMKGKAAPARAFRLVSSARGAADVVAAEPALVGRAAELTRLRAVLDDACAARACRLATVIGFPGVGKTRLAEEFGRSVADVADVVVGHCEPSGEGITFLPVAEVLRQVNEIGEADSPEEARRKLGLRIAEDDPDRDRLVERIAGVLGIAEPASVQETFWALRRGVEYLARERPLVLVLDDVHWGEPMFLDLIEHLVEWVRDVPVLILALARPELREARETLTVPGARATDVIDLQPLDEDECHALVAGVLGRHKLPEELSERIVTTAEGNPLFIGELLRMLVDEGALTRDGDAWVPARDIADVDVPPTIHALLAARIERLRADERSVVERAAVIGKQFYRGAVAELVAPPVRVGIDGHLEALRRKDMVEPEGTYWIDEPVYRFHHVLIRDAAYRSLLKEARAELHERFAEWLEAKAGALAGEHEEVIAFHLEQAHEYRRELGPLDDRGRALGAQAAIRLGSAGRRALARDDLAAATNLLERALRRLEPAEVAARCEFLLDLAEAQLAGGDTAAADEVVAQLHLLAGDDPRLRARADVLAAQLATLTGATGVEERVAALLAATAVLADAGDRAGEAKAHHVAAQAQALLGQVAAVEESLDHALAAARQADDRRRVTAVLAAAPRAALWGPSPVVRASGRCLDVVRILRMTPGNRHVEAIALRCQAVLEAMRGRTDAARDILAAGRATLEELGLSLELQETAIHAGIVELLAGDSAAAEAHLRGSVEGFTALGVDLGAAQAGALLARALVDQGRFDEAIAATEEAERHAGGDLKTTITWCGVRAEALARRGAHDEALALAQRAVDLAEPTDALPDKADAWMALATAHAVAGRGSEARGAAGRARELYAAKDHGAGVLRATALVGGAQPAAAAEPTTAVIEDAPLRAFDERYGAELTDGARIADPKLAAFFDRFAVLWASRDVDAITDAYPPGLVGVDHQRVSWGDAHGREGVEKAVRSVLDLSPDIRFSVEDVLAAGNGAVALRVSWRGRSNDTDGPFEVTMGWVSSIEGERMVTLDFYEHDAHEAMLARYAELTHDEPPLRVLKRFMALFAARDVDAMVALARPGAVIHDHRNLGLDTVSYETVQEVTRSLLEMWPDLRFELDEVVASDDRAVAYRATYHGTGAIGGGAARTPLSAVWAVEDGLVTGGDVYEHEDTAAILARFAELGGGQGPLGDRTPERLWKEFCCRFAARDVDGLAAFYTPASVFADHRLLAWEEVAGPQGFIELIRSSFAVSITSWLEVDEVLACDERTIALRQTWHVQSVDGGGWTDLPLGVVAVVEGGHVTRYEQYEPEDRAMLLARYDELRGSPAERLTAQFTECFNAHDLQGTLELVSDDFVYRDRRQLSLGDVDDREQFAPYLRSIFDVGPDLRREVDEVVACDERVIALRTTYRVTNAAEGGGAAERCNCEVWLVEDDRITRTEHYDADDTAAMIARYHELGGTRQGDDLRPPQRAWAEWARCLAARDAEGMARVYAEDFASLDHRAVGWGRRGTASTLPFVESILASSPDIQVSFAEVLACDDGAIAQRVRVWGTNADGGGSFEILMGIVSACDGERITRTELYDDDARVAMIARYCELGGGLSALGVRAPERWWRRYAPVYAARDLDALARFHRDDWAFADHRAMAWESCAGVDAVLGIIRSAYEISCDMRVEVREVLACDERVIAMQMAWIGTALQGGGPVELPLLTVSVIEHGRQAVYEQWEPADTEPALARYEELTRSPRGAEALVAAFADAHAVDPGRLADLVTADYRQVDHRRLGWGDVSGPQGVVDLLQSAVDNVGEIGLRVDELIDADEDVAAFIGSWHGPGAHGSGSWEMSAGFVIGGRDGNIATLDIYEPDDRAAMLARYAQLTGGVLGDRPPERWLAEYQRRFRDVDRLMELYAPDFQLTDHRAIGWEPVRGLEAAAELARSAAAIAPDLRMVIDEIVACDDRVLVARAAFRGRGVKAGELDYRFGGVFLVEHGLWVRGDTYEVDDDDAMLARYEELRAQRERIYHRFDRALNARDLDAVAALYTDDLVIVDRRTLAWEELHGPRGMIELLGGMLALGQDLVSHSEVLDDDAGPVILLRYTGTGTADALDAGPFEITFLVIIVLRGDQGERIENFNLDDEAAARARVRELRNERERPYARFDRLYNARDIDGLRAMYAPDVRLVDHRKAGWEDAHGPDALIELFETTIALAPDQTSRCEPLIDDGGDVALFRITVASPGADSQFGTFEIVIDMILVLRDGLIAHLECFEPSDPAAEARMRELTQQG